MMSGAIHEKHKFKYFKNLTVKVCKTWCNDVFTSILQCDIFWWKLIDRNFFNPIFSSPGLGVCRLLSVVCKLFTFQASSPKPLGQLEPNLAGMFLGWSSTKLLFFRSSRIFNMAARANNMLWLAEISKIFISETNELTEPKL